MAALNSIVSIGAVLAAVLSAGSSLKCYKGRTYGKTFSKTDTRPQNCTNSNEVCVRIDYRLDDKDIVIRDCMSPQHGSEKLESARDELKQTSLDLKTLPSLKSVLTCSKEACISATWIEKSWILMLVAATAAVSIGSR
ncbi:hypothetical protein R5R35_011949 [Gryllus longicercus]|uniref:Accessory gland protein n=1 Tax=Gryllus longicercus TaxID=2509291 RepID=A0AAN9V368_9ORTH